MAGESVVSDFVYMTGRFLVKVRYLQCRSKSSAQLVHQHWIALISNTAQFHSFIPYYILWLPEVDFSTLVVNGNFIWPHEGNAKDAVQPHRQFGTHLLQVGKHDFQRFGL